ncbi:MAG: helicase-related protein, partial [Amphiplicatus sp.]
DILLTTPEQLALLLSHKDSARLFAGLKSVIVDELHAMAGGKRGHLLALGLARLRSLAPALRCTGLSATVPNPQPLLGFLVGSSEDNHAPVLIRAAGGAKADVDVLNSDARIPWSGHSARHAWGEIYEAIRGARMTLVFVNTRSQAEMTFQALWRMNDDNLAIALHHGSLDVERRRKVEAAMAKGSLRAVVCTSTLDLGIDWGDVDLVIQVGAPKGASRITQRIGRANHRMDEPSRALLIPGNRFEVLECLAAQAAIGEGALDGEPPRVGALDVLAQHILGMACASPFYPDALYKEVVSASPYAELDRETFDRVLDFVATGGYALKSYDRYRRVVKTPEGLYRIRNPQAAQQYRMNVGTIVESPGLNIRLMTARGPKRPGRKLGTLEEWFIEGLVPGDTFLFAGEILRFEGVDGQDALVTRAPGEDPKTPMWSGGKFPLSTYLADRVRRMIAAPTDWKKFPSPVRDWLELQREHSVIPKADELLVETFPYVNRHFLVCYPFDGRLAHQTLGMLIARRLERAGLQPLGFVATEYAVSIWGRKDMSGVDMGALFAEDMLGDDLENWLAESVLIKRTFR